MRTAKLATRSAIIPQIVIALAVVFALSYHSPSVTQAVDVFTDPVGFYQVTLLTNSDTYVSIPFTRLPAFRGKIESVSGNVITVSGNPGWGANQFVFPADGVQSNTYYAFIASGTKEGAYYTITNNTANTLMVELVPEDLSGVSAGDRIQIIPYWSLGTAFPGGAGITPTTSLLALKTTILFPNIGGTGINLSAAALYYYFNGAWRRVGQPPTVSHNHQIILPDQYFVVRQSNHAPTTTMNPPGQVPMRKFRLPLYTRTGTRQDNFIGLARPAAQNLNQSALTNAFVATTSLLNLMDTLLVFDNTIEARNKSASEIYYYFNGAWRRVGLPPTTDVGTNQVFRPGTGVIIRKATTAAGETAFWVNSPNY